MISLVIRLIVSTVVVIGADRMLKGFQVSNLTTAVIVAIVMALLNTFVKPILQFFSFPITLLTLGLFYFVVNASIVYLCAYLIDGFSVSSFMAALLFSIALSIAQTITGWFLD